MAFPINPHNGRLYVNGDKVYIWTTLEKSWTLLPFTPKQLEILKKFNGGAGNITPNVSQDYDTVIGAGVSPTTLGTFTGSVIPDNLSVKVAIQTLETALEAMKDRRTKLISRGDSTEDVMPTVIEVPSPEDGDTAIIKLVNGITEYWTYTTSWAKTFNTTPAILDGNRKNITRVDSIVGIAPTAGEIPSPIDGDTAVVFLTDGKIEYWIHNGVSWALTNTFDPLILDGTDNHVSRVDSIEDVAPTIGEVSSPTLGDTAKVKLSNGTVEFWSHNGTTWTKDFNQSAAGLSREGELTDVAGALTLVTWTEGLFHVFLEMDSAGPAIRHIGLPNTQTVGAIYDLVIKNSYTSAVDVDMSLFQDFDGNNLSTINLAVGEVVNFTFSYDGTAFRQLEASSGIGTSDQDITGARTVTMNGNNITLDGTGNIVLFDDGGIQARKFDRQEVSASAGVNNAINLNTYRNFGFNITAGFGGATVTMDAPVSSTSNQVFTIDVTNGHASAKDVVFDPAGYADSDGNTLSNVTIPTGEKRVFTFISGSTGSVSTLLNSSSSEGITIQTLTDAALVTWDANDGQSAVLNVTADRNIDAIANPIDGELYTLTINPSNNANRYVDFDNKYVYGSEYGNNNNRLNEVFIGSTNPKVFMFIYNADADEFILVNKGLDIINVNSSVAATADLDSAGCNYWTITASGANAAITVNAPDANVLRGLKGDRHEMIMKLKASSVTTTFTFNTYWQDFDGVVVEPITLGAGEHKVLRFLVGPTFANIVYIDPSVNIQATLLDSSGGTVTETLDAATGSGDIKFFANEDITSNSANLAVQAGESLNGVTDGSFLFSNYADGTQFIATDIAAGKWVVSVEGASTPVDSLSEDIDVVNDISSNITTSYGDIFVATNSLVVDNTGRCSITRIGGDKALVTIAIRHDVDSVTQFTLGSNICPGKICSLASFLPSNNENSNYRVNITGTNTFELDRPTVVNSTYRFTFTLVVDGFPELNNYVLAGMVEPTSLGNFAMRGTIDSYDFTAGINIIPISSAATSDALDGATYELYENDFQSWRSSDTLTVPTGKGGIYDCRLSLIHPDNEIINVGGETQNASGTEKVGLKINGVDKWYALDDRTGLSDLFHFNGEISLSEGDTIQFISNGNITANEDLYFTLEFSQKVESTVVMPDAVPVEELSFGTVYISSGGTNATIAALNAVSPESSGLTQTGAGFTIDKAGKYYLAPHASLVGITQDIQLKIDGVTKMTFSDDGVNSNSLGVTVNVSAGQLVTLETDTNADWSVGADIETDVNATRVRVVPVAGKTVVNTTDTTVNDQSASGYMDVGNMRMQWGVGTANNTHTFPVAFGSTPTVTTTAYSGGNGQLTHLSSAPSTTGFTTIGIDVNGSFQNHSFAWQAIGLKP